MPVVRRMVQRGLASVRSPEGAPDAPSHKMIETVHPGIYPSKLGTKLLEPMFVFQGLFHIRCMFDLDLIWIGQSLRILSWYLFHHLL